MTRSTWVLVGDVGGQATYHVGDEAMLDANLELLGAIAPGLEAVVVSADPEWSARAYGVRAVPRLGFGEPGRDTPGARDAFMARLVDAGADAAGAEAPAIQALARADGLIISGGGNLRSTWPDLVYERATLAQIAYRRGIPVAILGQTLGPNLDPPERGLVGEMVTHAAMIGVRDASSYALALGLGAPVERLVYHCDDALALPPRPSRESWTSTLVAADAEPWIAVTIHPVTDPRRDDRWLDALAGELAALASQTGCRLVFLPHVSFPRDAATLGDRDVGEAIAARLPGHAMIVGHVLPARETRWLTGHAALIVSTRFHPLIFGIAAGVPGLGIAVDAYTRIKIEGAVAHAGRGGDVCWMSDAIKGELSERGMGLWRDRGRVGAELAGRRDVWRQLDARKMAALAELTRSSTSAAWRAPKTAASVEAELLMAHLSGSYRSAIAAIRGHERGLAAAAQERAAADANASRYLLSMRDHVSTVDERLAEAIRYARSLEAANGELNRQLADATQYVSSLKQRRGWRRLVTAITGRSKRGG